MLLFSVHTGALSFPQIVRLALSLGSLPGPFSCLHLEAPASLSLVRSQLAEHSSLTTPPFPPPAIYCTWPTFPSKILSPSGMIIFPICMIFFFLANSTWAPWSRGHFLYIVNAQCSEHLVNAKGIHIRWMNEWMNEQVSEWVNGKTHSFPTTP
jgi:hypothetical protein